eukprot:gene9769-15165_t
MWDLLDDVVTYLASSDRLQHGPRWSGFRRYPDCVVAGEVVEEVMYYLDRTRQFKFSTKGYVVWLCQKLVDAGLLLRVSHWKPSDMRFDDSPKQFWRLHAPEKNDSKGGMPLLRHPFVAEMGEFPAAGQHRWGMVTDTGLLCVYSSREEVMQTRPFIGVCLSQFSVAVADGWITLAHPHSCFADVRWKAKNSLEAAAWGKELGKMISELPSSRSLSPARWVPSPLTSPNGPSKDAGGLPRVVILGGGYCGVRVAQKLQMTHDVTLVDSKDYFENTPSVLRTIVDPDYQKFIHRCKRRTYRSLRGNMHPFREPSSGSSSSLDATLLCGYVDSFCLSQAAAFAGT